MVLMPAKTLPSSSLVEACPPFIVLALFVSEYLLVAMSTPFLRLSSAMRYLSEPCPGVRLSSFLSRGEKYGHLVIALENTQLIRY